MEPVVSDTNSDLDTFLDFLYDGLEGYIYLAAKDPHDSKVWRQEFCHYPSEINKAKDIITNASKKFEVYIGPALYREPTDAQYPNVKSSNVVWTEFDGNAPTEWEAISEPSLILQSSTDKNIHVYWRLNSPLNSADEIAEVNRRITYNLQADSSAWDATQVLRPPNSYNHKRQAPTVLIHTNQTTYDLDIFNDLSPIPEQITPDDWKLASLPDVNDLILRYKFTEDMVLLFKKDKNQVQDRSASLMNLAYGLCQMGMSNVEVYVLLLNADDRWEKFKYRKDREKRLLHIITVARNKYPEPDIDSDDAFTIALPYKSFLDTKIEVDWAIEPMLMDQGSMLFVGPPGIGKTQLSLQYMIHIALGKDYLHYKVPKPKKVAFLSAEMGMEELQFFLNQMDVPLTAPERDLLEENFYLIPHGEMWPLNKPEGQHQLLQLLDAIEPDGLFIDSIGTTLMGNVSSDEVVQPWVAFMYQLRKHRSLFVWTVHHTRKKEQGSNGTYTQDDVYGNQYLFAQATSCYGVLPGKGGTLKIRNFKNRLAPKEADFLLERKENLQFEPASKAVDDMVEHNITGEKTSTKAPGGFDL